MIDVYLTDEVTWIRSGGMDEYNEPITDTEQVIPAHVCLSGQLVLGPDGREVMATGFLYVKVAPTMADRWQINAFSENRVFGTAKIDLLRDFTQQFYKVWFV